MGTTSDKLQILLASVFDAGFVQLHFSLATAWTDTKDFLQIPPSTSMLGSTISRRVVELCSDPLSHSKCYNVSSSLLLIVHYNLDLVHNRALYLGYTEHATLRKESLVNYSVRKQVYEFFEFLGERNKR